MSTCVVIWSRGLSYACTRQTLSRIYRYSLTVIYEAISDWICNCFQRLHEFFHFLPVSHQIDIRTAKFFGKFHV